MKVVNTLEMSFAVRVNTAAVYPGFHASMCDYVLWTDARPLQLTTPLPSVQHLIRFSDSSSVPIYTPSCREALGYSKVSLTKEQLAPNDLSTAETLIP